MRISVQWQAVQEIEHRLPLANKSASDNRELLSDRAEENYKNYTENHVEKLALKNHHCIQD